MHAVLGYSPHVSPAPLIAISMENSNPYSICPRILVWAVASLGVLIAAVGLAVPVAVDDSYDATEDLILNTRSGPIISADFDQSSGGVVPEFEGEWDYLDRLENQLGANHDYPTDDAGRVWSSVDFDIASSSVGPWSSGSLPLQGGVVQAFPADTPDLLRGIGDGPNGQNLVTTYLFRNTFVLTPEEAAEEKWIANLAVDDGCVIYINGEEAGSILMPDSAIGTNTLAGNGNESVYTDVELDVGGVLVAGRNTVAIEVHQGSLGSSDAGLDISLRGGGGLTGGFVFVDDAFGTDQPEYATGILDPSGGESGGGLYVTIGGLDTGSSRVPMRPREPSCRVLHWQLRQFWRSAFDIVLSIPIPLKQASSGRRSLKLTGCAMAMTRITPWCVSTTEETRGGNLQLSMCRFRRAIIHLHWGPTATAQAERMKLLMSTSMMFR